jgi:hypothetical protein
MTGLVTLVTLSVFDVPLSLPLGAGSVGLRVGATEASVKMIGARRMAKAPWP